MSAVSEMPFSDTLIGDTPKRRLAVVAATSTADRNLADRTDADRTDADRTSAERVARERRARERTARERTARPARRGAVVAAAGLPESAPARPVHPVHPVHPALPVHPARPVRPRPAAAPLRLTRRGRTVVTAAALVLAAGLASLIVVATSAGAQATDHGQPGGGYAGMREVVVRPGQTLWSIAAAAEPSADPRVVIQQIMTVNSLTTSQIEAGQLLWVPK